MALECDYEAFVVWVQLHSRVDGVKWADASFDSSGCMQRSGEPLQTLNEVPSAVLRGLVLVP